MSSEQRIFFTKENLDSFLKEVAKEYRKLSGKAAPAELILIGGASVLINYGFRNMTTDVDAVIEAASSMKEAINRVGDRFGLPNGWLNSDFKRTDSYTPKLVQYATYYRTFSNIVTVRTIAAEYLIAMKLRSGRQYKSDLSDVLGILAEHETSDRPITMDRIKTAVGDLYGDWAVLSDEVKHFIENAMKDGRFDAMYAEIAAGEQAARNALIDFEHEYPGIVNQTNVNDIIQNLRKRQAGAQEAPSEKPSVQDRLQSYQTNQKNAVSKKRRKKHGDWER